MQLFKYLACLVNKKKTGDADIETKDMQSRNVVGEMRAIMDTKELSLECASLLQEFQP